MFEYSCPECGKKLRAKQQAKPGQKVKCPDCQGIFVPRAEIMGLAPEAPAAPPPPPPFVYENDDDASPYAVIKESAEEELIAQKNKPVIGAIRDKFKRSAKGPASAQLVLPSNLLLAQGGLTGVAGVALCIVGAFPLVFTDAPPSDEEIAENWFLIFGGITAIVWAAIVCFGASHMSNVDHYSWAVVGAVFGLLPLLAGIFALITLFDPKVIAGFEEPEGGPNQQDPDETDQDDDDEDEDDEDDDDEEDEDEEERPRRRRR